MGRDVDHARAHLPRAGTAAAHAEDEWGELAPMLITAAKAVLPPDVADDLRPHQPYISGATLALVAARRELVWAAERQRRSLASPALKRELQRMRQRINRSIRRDKARHASAVARRLLP